MKKHELLVPAGDMECLLQAVYNGCDAVYVSGVNYGARKFATNFSIDDLVKAIEFCHIYGVKIYVTMNTLIKNEEVDDFIEQARFLHKNGVDALIVQDFGMICLLRKKFPNLEIHASTQANNSSVDTCLLFSKLGVKRVVFSRELSIDDIDRVNVDIEKEAFIHGALCVSYSGCCLMSSMLGGRSGNRGECAGCCRMPFSLMSSEKMIEKNKYLLSMKELNTASEIKRLLNSSIYSFKIEGRMKSPLYVGFITRLYRRLIDGDNVDILYELSRLKTIFNRDFTLGHMFNISGKKFINEKIPNHIGLEVGKVSRYKDKIKIELYDGCELNQFDAVRLFNNKRGMIVNYLYDNNMNLCSKAKGICFIDNRLDLVSDDVLMKTHDYLLENEYKNIKNGLYKDKVNFNVTATIGNHLLITIDDGYNSASVEGSIVQTANNAPIDDSTFIRHLSKLGNSPYDVGTINIHRDENVFIQIKEINELRRKLVECLNEKRKKDIPKFEERDFYFELSKKTNFKTGYTCSVHTEEQLLKCFEYNFDRIYVCNKLLYQKYSKHSNVFLFLDRCKFKYDLDKDYKYLTSDYFNYSGYCVVGGYGLNVLNIYTAYFLNKIGLKNIPLSVELSDVETMNFVKLYNEIIGSGIFEIMDYGRVENMFIKGNILGLEKNEYSYFLIDQKKRKFPVFYDGINTHVLNYELVRKLENNDCYIHRLDFYDEDIIFIEKLLKKINVSKTINKK